MRLADFSDLVIYVQAVRRSTEADDPASDFDLNNQWAVGSEPTCAIKSAQTVPVRDPE